MSIAMPVRDEYPGAIPPPPAPHGSAPSGRLRFEGLPSADRTVAMWTHLAPLIAFPFIYVLAPIAPLVLWLSRKDVSSFVDDHGREVLNMSITGLIVLLVGGLIPIIGWCAVVIWYIVAFINIIRGSVAASGGEYFRYPMTLRFLQ